jgi:hypothetical protein
MANLIFPFRSWRRPAVVPVHRIWPFIWRRPRAEPGPSALRLIFPYRAWRRIAVPASPVSTVAADFFDAATNFLRSNVATVFPGGFHAIYQGANGATPYAVLELDDDDPTFTGGGSYFYWGRLKISVYAGSGPLAKSLAIVALNTLQDAPLVFTDGILTYLRRGQGSFSKDTEPAPAAGSSYVCVRWMKYMIANHV